MPTAYHVFISADMAVEAERVAARDHMSSEAALAKVKKSTMSGRFTASTLQKQTGEM